MTVQTQTQGQVFSPVRTKSVRGIRSLLIGLAAIALGATTWFGIAAVTDEPEATVIAPVVQNDAAAEQRAVMEHLEQRNLGPFAPINAPERTLENAPWLK